MLAEARPRGRPIVDEVEYMMLMDAEEEGEGEGVIFSLTNYLVDKLFPKSVPQPRLPSSSEPETASPEQEDGASTTEIMISPPTPY